MTSHHLVDPDLHALIAAFPPLGLSPETLDDVRAALAAAPKPAVDHDDTRVTVEERVVAGPADAPALRVLVYRPSGAGEQLRPALLHIHGGGFVLGAADGADVGNRGLARALGCVVVSVDYRLAPETRFPGAVEDCHAALRWLHAAADELGVDPARIGIKGESAGGGLAAALALLARDRGGPAIAFQHLIYPMLDDRTCTHPDPHPLTGEYVWTAADNRFGWTALLGTAPGGADISPYAAPARATDLSDLPPAYIATGALDLFLEENLDYARRLSRAGVPIELHVYPGAFHGFQMAPDAAVTRTADRDSLAALRRVMATG